MKQPLIALAAGAAVLAFAVQVQLPPALAGHVAKLKDAQSLKARVLVNEVGGAQTTTELSYSKPNLLRIDGPAQLVVADGKTVTVLDKAKNSYTQTEYTAEDLHKFVGQTSVWAWEPFFQPDPNKLYKAAKAGPARKLRGVDVNEVEVTLADGKTAATLYVEAKTGLARGFQVTVDAKQFIVWTESVLAGTAALPAADYAFTAPAGATKLEPGEVGAVGWAEVATIFNRNCMPCHSAQARSGTLDLSSYAAVAGHRFVVKGESKNSILALALRAAGPKRMPQGRPPLPEAQIKAVEAWIDGGLKQ
jgi:outer membrane lipoprotein-sorting protein